MAMCRRCCRLLLDEDHVDVESVIVSVVEVEMMKRLLVVAECVVE